MHPEQEGATAANRRIVVAHPDAAIRDGYAQALGSVNCEVIPAATAGECLSLARKFKPSVVIVFPGLQKKDPVGFCGELKSDPLVRDVFVVLASREALGASPGFVDDRISPEISTAELVDKIGLWVRLQRTHAALCASEALYQQLLEVFPDPIGFIDGEGRIVGHNARSVAVLGSGLSGKSVFDIVAPEDHERLRAHIQAASNGQVVTNAEYQVVGTHGQQVLFQVNAAPVAQPNGGGQKLLLIAKDVTEQTRIQAACAEQERSLRNFLETALEGVWILDDTGQTTYASQPMAAMLGYTVQEMQGRHLYDFMDEAARTDATEKLKHRAAGIAERHEFCFRRKNGTELWARLSTAPLRDNSGRYIGALGMVTDITESKHWADALVASEMRYRSLVELSPDAIYINRGDRIRFANAAALKLFGASSPDQVLNRSPLDFFAPECHEMIRQRREALSRGETVPLVEHKIVRLDGQVVDVAVTAGSTTDQDGPAIQVILRDITERKKAEAALWQREALSQKILATAMDGFWMAGLDGTLREVNEAYCRMSGYSREELLSMRISDLEVVETSQEAVAQHIERIVRAGADRFETRHRCKNGRVIDVEVSVNYLEPGRGCVFAFLHDISERKRTQEKLAMLAHAVESTSEPICITDLHDRFVFVNRAFHKIYGYTDAEILGKTPDKLVSPKNPPALLAEILQQSRLGGWRGEVLDRRKDGTEFPVSLSSSQVKDSAGRVIGLMGVAQDITQRLRAEAALRESERDHRLLFETIEQGVVYQDASGKVISMNPAAERILGKTRAEFLGQTSMDTQHHTIREDGSPFPGAEHPSMVALRTGKNTSAVMGVFNPRQKCYRWIRISAVPLFRDGQEHPYRVHALFDDITDRKAAQDSLKEAHRKTTAVLESITDGFNSFNRQWRYTYVNKPAARIMHSTPEQLLGRNVWEVWPKAAASEIGRGFRRAVSTQQPVQFEEFYPEPLNVWLEVRCYPSAEGLSVFFTDITERRAAEEKFQQNRALLNAIFSSLQGRVAVIGREGSILQVNEAWLEFGASSGAEVAKIGAGANYLRVCREAKAKGDEEAAQVLEGIESVLKGGRSEFSAQYRCQAPGAPEAWFEIQVHPLRVAEGGAVIAHVDITAAKKAEAEMQLFRENLSHISRVTTVGELTASLAHELNQPLTAILSNVQAAQRFSAKGKMTSREFKEILNDLVGDVERCAGIVKGLRSFLRKSQREFAPLNLNELVSGVARMVRSDALIKNISVHLDLADALPTVMGDSVQLGQLLLNLMVNGIEAMENATGRRKLEVATSMADGWITVSVKDTGTGIGEPDQEHLFESFFTRKAKGMGLGLPICRSIAEAHGGRVWGANNLDCGATFQFTMPVSGGKP